MNNGRKIIFLHDHWGTSTPLKYELYDLYSLAKSKKCSLQKLLWVYLVKGQMIFENKMFHPSQYLIPRTVRLSDILNSTQLTDGDDVIS